MFLELFLENVSLLETLMLCVIYMIHHKVMYIKLIIVNTLHINIYTFITSAKAQDKLSVFYSAESLSVACSINKQFPGSLSCTE